MVERYMQIGEVAEKTGLTSRTLRFYEEKGLLKPPTRMEGGFRLYSEEDVQRIQHILQLKQLLGFTLADIKEMLEAEETLGQLRAEYRQEPDPEGKIERVRKAIQVIQAQAALIDQKIEQLSQMRIYWQRKLEHYKEHYTELARDLEGAQVPLGN